MNSNSSIGIASIDKIVGDICDLQYRNKLTDRASEQIDEKILDVITGLAEVETMLQINKFRGEPQ